MCIRDSTKGVLAQLEARLRQETGIPKLKIGYNHVFLSLIHIYDARIAELNEKVNSLYGQIMGNEGMVAYNEAKRECENLVNYIDAIINTAMNGGDPMTCLLYTSRCV